MHIDIPKDRPVLIAGPTASGKSALALMIAEAQGGLIVNADALQVYDGWRVLTARPNDADLALAPHALYGHVGADSPYSVGDWLKDVAPLLPKQRVIIVGGTGLYFTALINGLAPIPPTAPEIRAQADAMPLHTMLHALDDLTRAGLDINNRARVQRAWEVQAQTGRSIAVWQAETPPPLLPLSHTVPIVLDAPKDWLTPRIETRFQNMLIEGALEEARAMLPHWDPKTPSSKAIGAPELIAYLRGEIDLAAASEAATIATRQYAKRQRTWFNKRMRDWHHIAMASTDLSTVFNFQH